MTNIPLDDHWDIWIHNNNNDWTINGYTKLITITTIQEYWNFFNNVPKVQGILFLMRKDILPIWEYVENKQGGAFTLFFSEDNYHEYLTKISSYLVSENLLVNDTLETEINGISLTSKHNSYSLKIWIKDAKEKDNIQFKPEINLQSLNFKKHFD